MEVFLLMLATPMIKKTSIKEFNGNSEYDQWMFVYDPRMEQTAGSGGVFVAGPVGANGATGMQVGVGVGPAPGTPPGTTPPAPGTPAPSPTGTPAQPPN